MEGEHTHGEWRAIDENGGKTSSEESSFTTKTEYQVLLLSKSPQDNTTDVTLLPTLSWSESTDPDEHDIFYVLTITKEGESPKKYTVQTNSYTFSSPLDEATYTWSVEANDGKDGKSLFW